MIQSPPHQRKESQKQFLSPDKPTTKLKKKSKKPSSKGKSSKTKKSLNVSPNGKTLSTESTNGQSPGVGINSEDSNGDIIKVIRKNPPREDAKRRNSKDDVFLYNQEHKTAHLNLLGKRFKIEDDMLGYGSFGRTYLGQDVKRQKPVAIKIMLKKKSMDSFLREATVLRSVNYLNHSGFPQMLMSAYNEDICILVEDLLGVNLETLRKRHPRLSLAVVCSIGIQLLNRLESLHECGFIHRDIKPQNILLGGDRPNKSNKIYLIDFGLSVSYIDGESGAHYKENPNSNYSTVVGTALFASINAHMGRDLSRRDDIESLVYTLIYLCTGTLPWKNINIKKKSERHQIIMYLKEGLSSSVQLQQNLEYVPSEIFKMLNYCQRLSFDQQPDYKYMKGLLQKIIKKYYSGIKKIKDIDLFNNNSEEQLPYLPRKEQQQSSPLNKMVAMPQVKPEAVNIDISGIAFQFGRSQADGASSNLISVASNEQLGFRSDLDGKSNGDLLKEEILHKLNPAMYRQLFSGPSDENIPGRVGMLIDKITEESCESDSYGEEDDDEEGEQEENSDDEESKNSPSHKMRKFNQEFDDDEQEDEGESEKDDVGDQEDDIPDDDLEACAQIQGYFMKAKDNYLKDKKGGHK